MRRKPRMALVVTSVGLWSACAQQAVSVHGAAAVGDEAWPSDVVTAADLASGGDSRSVLEALQHVRPSFLNALGPPPAVVLDDSFATDVSILGMLSAADVCEIRLQRPTSGAGRSVLLANGAVSSGDVLLVRTRRAGPTQCGGDRARSERSARGMESR